MYNPKDIDIIKCSNVDLSKYSIITDPEIDIVYKSIGNNCNPIFETDWIDMDGSDITDNCIYIPSDNKQDSVNDLFRIALYVKNIINQLDSYIDTGRVIHYPPIMMTHLERKIKTQIPILKPPSNIRYKEPIRVKFYGSFTVTVNNEITARGNYRFEHVEFNILHLIIDNEYTDDHFINSMDGLHLSVTI